MEKKVTSVSPGSRSESIHQRPDNRVRLSVTLILSRLEGQGPDLEAGKGWV